MMASATVCSVGSSTRASFPEPGLTQCDDQAIGRQGFPARGTDRDPVAEGESLEPGGVNRRVIARGVNRQDAAPTHPDSAAASSEPNTIKMMSGRPAPKTVHPTTWPERAARGRYRL